MSQKQETDTKLDKLRKMTFAELEALVRNKTSESPRPYLDPYHDSNLQAGLAAIKQGVTPSMLEQAQCSHLVDEAPASKVVSKHYKKSSLFKWLIKVAPSILFLVFIWTLFGGAIYLIVASNGWTQFSIAYAVFLVLMGLLLSVTGIACK